MQLYFLDFFPIIDCVMIAWYKMEKKWFGKFSGKWLKYLCISECFKIIIAFHSYKMKYTFLTWNGHLMICEMCNHFAFFSITVVLHRRLGSEHRHYCLFILQWLEQNQLNRKIDSVRFFGFCLNNILCPFITTTLCDRYQSLLTLQSLWDKHISQNIPHRQQNMSSLFHNRTSCCVKAFCVISGRFEMD